MPIIVSAGYNAGTGLYGLAVVSANMIGLGFILGEFGIGFTVVVCARGRPRRLQVSNAPAAGHHIRALV